MPLRARHDGRTLEHGEVIALQRTSRWALAADMVDPPELRYRRDPVAWARERAGVELWSKQVEILESVHTNPNTAVRSCHSAGKGLALDTPLPTPGGWTTMGEVRPGDELISEMGEPCRVVWVSPVRTLDCYRLRFSTGDEITCDGDHLWNVLRYRRISVTDWRDHWDHTKTRSARELRTSDGVPLTRPVLGQDVQLPVDPYFLGAWLGDGRQHELSIGVALEDREIIDHCVERTGWQIRERIEDFSHIKLTYKKFLRVSFQADRPGTQVLRDLGVWRNKHIPSIYLRASVEDRIALLRGLLDTDGNVIGKGAGIWQKSSRLMRDIIELIASLGAKISATGKGNLDDTHGVQLYSTFNPFHLTRKRERWDSATTSHPSYRTMTGIKSITPTLTVPTRCIAVDSPSAMFLAGRSMVPTHNSFISAVTTCWWLDVHPPGTARVITTAPTSKQVDAVLWYEINKLHSELGLRGQCNLREIYYGRQLVALGRKPPDHQEAAFQGMHARYLLVVYDEAYGIPKGLWDEGSSLASNEDARQLAIGNPDGPGEFEENCRSGSDWNVIHISYRHTPNFTGEPVSAELKSMLISQRWVSERSRKWGPKSALFQSKCDGNFPSGGDPFAVVQYDWAMKCKNTEYPASDPVEAGIDVGGGGDRTVIRERRGLVAGREEEFIDADPMRTVGRLAEKIAEWGVMRVKVDSTGLGWGIAGRLRELSSRHNPVGAQRGETTHSAEVVPVNFGAGPPPGFEKKFLNMRAYLWWQVGRENSRLRAWDLTEVDEDVIHELTSPRYVTLDSYGKLKIEPKRDVIKRLGFSPDRAEGLLLAFYSPRGTATTVGWSEAAGADLLGDALPGDRLTEDRWGVVDVFS